MQFLHYTFHFYAHFSREILCYFRLHTFCNNFFRIWPAKNVFSRGINLIKSDLLDGYHRSWSSTENPSTGLLGCSIKDLPASVACKKVGSSHPRLVPHMEIPVRHDKNKIVKVLSMWGCVCVWLRENERHLGREQQRQRDFINSDSHRKGLSRMLSKYIRIKQKRAVKSWASELRVLVCAFIVTRLNHHWGMTLVLLLGPSVRQSRCCHHSRALRQSWWLVGTECPAICKLHNSQGWLISNCCGFSLLCKTLYQKKRPRTTLCYWWINITSASESGNNIPVWTSKAALTVWLPS